MTTPVFERTVSDRLFGPLDTSGLARTDAPTMLDRLLSRWDQTDRLNAHAEIDGYLATTANVLGEGHQHLGEDAVTSEGLDEVERLLRDHLEANLADPQIKTDVEAALETLNAAHATLAMLRTIVDDCWDPTVRGRVEMALAKLTPEEGE